MDAESQLLAEKDAEIERLEHVLDVAVACISDQRKLITELCDALESIPATAHWDWSVKLLQRAREVTK